MGPSSGTYYTFIAFTDEFKHAAIFLGSAQIYDIRQVAPWLNAYALPVGRDHSEMTLSRCSPCAIIDRSVLAAAASDTRSVPGIPPPIPPPTAPALRVAARYDPDPLAVPFV